MDQLTSMFFYGGIGTAVFGAVVLVVSFVVLRIRKVKLDAIFDKEYGEKFKR